MKSMFIATVVIGLMWNDVCADANKGQLFGFTIGEKYELEDASELKNVYWDVLGVRSLMHTKVVPSDALLPAEFDRAVLSVTPISLTITNICGESRELDNQAARNLQSRLFDVLRRKYPEWDNKGCSGEESLYRCRLEKKSGLFSVKYLLHVNHDSNSSLWAREQGGGGLRSVSVCLSLGDNEKREQLDALEEKEKSEFDTQRRERRARKTDDTGL